MKPVPYDAKPDDTTLREIAEMSLVKVEDGVEYDPKSLLAQQFMEASGRDCPATLIDENVPWRFWKLVASRIKALSRRTASDDLRSSREVAGAFARHLARERVTLTPARAQMDLFDHLMLSIPEGTTEAEFMRMRYRFDDVLRCFRETAYVCFNNEYMDRKIG